MKKDFVFTVGHATVIAFLINTLTEIDANGKVVKGMDKATARITTDLTEILDLNDGKQVPISTMNDPYELKGEFSSLHIKWVKERINEVFDAKLMPFHFARIALDLVDNWE